MDKQSFIKSRSTIETLLIVLFFLGLIYALLDVLKVFLGIFTFSLIFAISFARLFEKLVSLCKGRRKLAAFIYTFLLIAIIVQPFLFLISTLSHHVKEISHFVTDVKENGLPPLSASISGMPVIGESISNFYTQLQTQPKETLAQHEQQIKAVLHGIVIKGAGVFGAAAEIILGIIISAFFLSGGDKMVAPFSNALKHILGKEDTDALLNTSVMAIKGVSIGIMGTGFIAAIVAWIGLFIAGIPFSLGIAAIVFFLVIIQVGPLPVWIPIVIWLFIQGHAGWAVFMIIYGIVLLGIDSVIKPLLISKSGKLPFLVLFLGVIGGMVAWGFTGMFKGAIIVAVFYTVFINWLERKETAPDVAV
jgi:predicted PurR-regulated permease PerM